MTLTCNYGPLASGFRPVVSVTDGTDTVRLDQRFTTEIIRSEAQPAVVKPPPELVESDSGFANSSVTLNQNVVFCYTLQHTHPKWLEWGNSGLLSGLDLTDQPETAEEIFDREKAAAVAQIDGWLTAQDAAGISINGGDGLTATLKSDSQSATSLAVLLQSAASYPDETPLVLSDVNENPVSITAGQFRAFAGDYQTQYFTRRAAWAAAKGGALAATTVEQLSAALTVIGE